MQYSEGPITETSLFAILALLWTVGTVAPAFLGVLLWLSGRRAIAAAALVWACIFAGASTLVFSPTTVEIPERLSGPDEFSTGVAAGWARSDGAFRTIGAGTVQCFSGASTGSVALLKRGPEDEFYQHPEFVWTDNKCRSKARFQLTTAAGVTLADLAAITLLTVTLRRTRKTKNPQEGRKN